MNHRERSVLMESLQSKDKQIHILVVDDETSILEFLQEGIQLAGYSCSTASRAKEALEIMECGPTDIVIADVNMPGMSGLELVEQIKGKYDSDVIVMTGYAADYTYEEIIGLGASDFIQKPIRIAEFIARIKRVLTERTISAERDRAVSELRENLCKFQTAMEGFVQAISLAVEIRDPYTAGHQCRVTDLTCAIADELNLKAETKYGLRMASVIHDLGKITVPAEILNRPGPLSDLEYGIIKNHVQAGYDILRKIDFPWPLAEIILQHHERMDGSGYPRGLLDKEILVEAKILAVADVFETITSHRPYRPSLGMNKAVKEISENSGVLYDARVAEACIDIFINKKFKFEEKRGPFHRVDTQMKTL